ncbi:gluconate:H+ symporter [Hymenobacter sp. BRD67]|uniref:gluconate:H+ symporter n=1 Tax=Hymenobacter sp. BRD67 TaxID=2675877 RepID=UPI0015657516|nr:gluconate:H+ symporter [Hymenobacter sp. BRD67]QKG51945.1 gluconate transporter [Hymenobacter sp. BRD67]
MTSLLILLAVLALIGLISWARIAPFLAFLLVALGLGFSLRLPPAGLVAAISQGFGEALGSVAILIVLGAMLGKLVADSGAAQQIATVMTAALGARNIQWTLMAAGLIIGIPLFYNVGFVLVVPIVFSVAYRYRLPAVYVGLPVLASLSVLHGFLPPHPGPTALVAQLHASLGLTFAYGLLLAVPAIILAGPLYARTLRHIVAVPLPGFVGEVLPASALPGRANSFLSSLLPVLVLGSLLSLRAALPAGTGAGPLLDLLAEPVVAMLLAVLVATISLGLARGRSISQLMDAYNVAIKDVAAILLIIGGAGALKQVLVASGASQEIAASLRSTGLPPLVLGWVLAATIRVCLGSATIAGLTAAGVLLPMLKQTPVNPNLLVLAIGAGSLALSHLNDAGFWLFKEYFNLSVSDTLRSWTVMETIVSVVGLLGVLLLSQVLPLASY